MIYELECGHCGFRFALEDEALTRTVKCAVCGGLLTVAVPVSVVAESPSPPVPARAAPAPEPEEPPAPEPEPGPRFPPLAPDRPDLDDLEPEERGRHLAPPWPAVRGALGIARTATEIGGALFVCALIVDLLLMPFAPRKDFTAVGRYLALTCGSLLIPACVNTICQLCCARIPLAHGAQWAGSSVPILMLAWFAYVLLLPMSFVLAITSAAGLVVVSFGVWLNYLALLARRLDDRDMKSEVWSYASWFCAGAVVSFGLLGFAALGERVGAGGTAWLLKVVTGAIGLRLIWGYAALLRTTTRAIDSRAPVVPRV